MTTIMPEGDAIRKAVSWISECLQEDPSRTSASLIQAASARFDLSPKDAGFLLRFYQNSEKGSGSDQA